jgi:molybdopterin-guanine dinucleotide biosynthesis protein A
VLAGGGATRMGGVPKGLLEVGGRRVLDRVVDALVAALGSPPLLVANAPEATSWAPDLRLVRDVRPGLGALGGLLTAVELRSCSSDLRRLGHALSSSRSAHRTG